MGPKIIFLGMAGEYSRAALERLVEGGVEVAAFIFPRPQTDAGRARWLPAAAQRRGDMELLVKAVRENALSYAGSQGIPVLEVGSMKDAETLAVLKELNADLAVTACFPQLLPTAFLEIPRAGCMNIHPSRLPAYRGPEPLFWQFRAGEENTGVTVHWMDAGADTGDVMGQTRLSFWEGISSEEAERLAARSGAELILEAIRKNEFPRTPQGNEGASYQGIPGEADKVIPASWGVRRAFRFLRGAEAWAPFWIEGEGGVRVEVMQAIGYEEGLIGRAGHGEKAGEVRVEMGDGVLLVR